jgi:transcriptional regulator with XRE-family HTH domain
LNRANANLTWLGMLIRNERRRNGISLRTAGQQTGISASALSRLERGFAPTYETLTKLAVWLGCTVDTLLLGGEAAAGDMYRMTTLDTVEMLLRSDDRLTVEGADVLVGLIRQVYAALTR